MTNFSWSWKHDQVFISFRGKPLRNTLVSNLKEELKRNNIKFFMDEDELRGKRIKTFFDTIRQSGVALVLFSNNYSESYWCLDELVEINKQMEIGYLDAFPVFYKVTADSVKEQTDSFGRYLLKTEENLRKKVDRGSEKSILETEARIWGWRQALVNIKGSLGIKHPKGPEGPLISKIVIELKKLIDDISHRRNDLCFIEKPLMHPQKPLTSLLEALNLNKSDLEDLITRPYIEPRGSQVFLDLVSVKNPCLGQRSIERGEAAGNFLVLLGSIDIDDEDFEFKPRSLSRKHPLFSDNKLIVSSQENQDQSYYSRVQVTNSADVLSMSESNDNTRNRLGEDKKSDCHLTSFSFLCNIMKCIGMMISPPPPSVFISFGDKQLRENLVSSLKEKLESNGISVYVEDETKERIKESKVAIVVFSDKYPESPQCLDELVEINKLLDAKEIDPFPIFYKLKNVNTLAQSVKELKGYFRTRLLKIEQEVRKTVKRENVKSILETEARFCEWREALKSISSRPGLSNENISDPVFFANVVTKVKELLEVKDKPKKSSSDTTSNQVTEEKPTVHKRETAAEAITTVKSLDDDLFYSLPSFLEALNFKITDLDGFTEMHNGLISLCVRRHTNLVCLKYSSLAKLVQFQRSMSCEFLTKRFLPAFAPPDVATFTSTSPVKAEPVTPHVTKSEPTTTFESLNTETPLVFGSSTGSVTFSTPTSNSSTNEVEENIFGSTSAPANSIFEMGVTPQKTRVGRLIKPTKKVLEMQWAL